MPLWWWLMFGIFVLFVLALWWGMRMWEEAGCQIKKAFLHNHGILHRTALLCWLLAVFFVMFVLTQIACEFVGWLLCKLAWVIAFVVALWALWEELKK